ncbi:fasciclin domain-containing protein [Limibacillus sp. MBR-115]|uniref:fasciclin domain-containing protein n=1 Tax=Limibacillus sp. MBR-115 TaxID=3156465 RepID=UPI00339986D0
MIKTMTRSKAALAAALFLLSGFAAQASDPRMTGKDIVETAVAAGSFKTLVAAVQAAGLVETLQGDGPFTVFAPSDDAFAKLPAGTVEMLLKPENKDKLVAILTYHVVPGRVPAKAVMNKTTWADTANGEKLYINGLGNQVFVGSGPGAGNLPMVVQANVWADNGVIHVVDEVIMPPVM